MSFEASLDRDRAYTFYREQILGVVVAKGAWYKEYGFKLPVTPSTDWEVFGAVLLRQRRSARAYGHDLESAEVKSCGAPGSSFEHQYHRKAGLTKLSLEHTINHIFVVYSADYLNVQVYRVNGEDLKDFFDLWLPQLEKNYTGTGLQRFRRSIPLGTVRARGKLVFAVQDGERTV